MQTTKTLRQLILTNLDENKAVDIQDFDVSSLTDITDYIILCSATSTRHANALADKLIQTLKTYDIRPIGVEGTEQGEWILLDYADVVIHIMLPNVRTFYDLAKLWSVTEKIRQGHEH